MEYQEVKILSKNDWKPIYELASLRLFSIFYPDSLHPRYYYQVSRDASEDGVFMDINSRAQYPAELVKVTNEDRETRASRFLKIQGVSDVPSSLKSNDIRETILKKINKKYSDVNQRILVLDASECVPFKWSDIWASVAEFSSSAPFYAIYALQSYGEMPEILVLKQPPVMGIF